MLGKGRFQLGWGCLQLSPQGWALPQLFLAHPRRRKNKRSKLFCRGVPTAAIKAHSASGLISPPSTSSYFLFPCKKSGLFLITVLHSINEPRQCANKQDGGTRTRGASMDSSRFQKDYLSPGCPVEIGRRGWKTGRLCSHGFRLEYPKYPPKYPPKCSWDGSEHPGGAQEFFCPVPHKYPGVNADYLGVIPQS